MLSDTLHKFEKLTKRPLRYLEGDNDTADKIKNSLKEVYDYVLKSNANNKHSTKIVPKLIVKNFDVEQIWQELELHNVIKYEENFSNVTNLLASKVKLSFPLSKKDDNSNYDDQCDEHSEEELRNEEVTSENSLNENESAKEKIPCVKEAVKRKRKTSVVDDRFFKLEELEEFLDKQDKAQERNKSEGLETEAINYFEGNSSDNENDEQEFYKDFFDPPDDAEGYSLREGDECINKDNAIDDDSGKRVKKLRFDLPSSDSNSASSGDESNFKDRNDLPKSSFQLRQERLQSRINKLEENALSEKPWQLTGEVTAQERPPNSLLEEVLEYDLTRRPAPVITEQTTVKLEDIIQQRIKDRVWDDVERKVKPILAPDEYRKKIVLDQEKSKLSLAQVYEQEYLKKKEALSSGLNDEPEEEEPQEHRTIRSMMSSLFAKLDALSNFHFTPKMIIPEVKIVSNLPAITMEEVAPVSTTDATLLAPEEVKVKQKGNLIGSVERTKTDKKRERRQKKRKFAEQKKREEKFVKKLNPGLGNKYSKEKALESLKQISNSKNFTLDDGSKGSVVRSSTAFFSRLQDDKTSGVNYNKNKKNKQEISAKRVKL